MDGLRYILRHGIATNLCTPQPLTPCSSQTPAPTIQGYHENQPIRPRTDFGGTVPVIDPSECSINLCAFLDCIATSEGTIGRGDDGYNVLYGGGVFEGYEDHPRQRLTFANVTSTAAGRYQLLSKYYDAYKASLDLPDFSPLSQDKIALQQIKECRAIPLIEGGNFDAAIAKCAHIWASFPGAGYGQHEQRIVTLRKAYQQAGGLIA